MAAMVGMLIWVKVVTGEAALVIILKHLPAIG